MGRVKRKGSGKHKKLSDKLSDFFDLRRQFTFLYVLVMIFTIGMVVILFNVFIEKFYLYEKERSLTEIYNEINTAAEERQLKSPEFGKKLENYSVVENTGILIISSLFEPIQIYSNEPEEILLAELREDIFGASECEQILKETENMVFALKKDERTNSEYLEMWGFLSDNSFFMLRTAIESMQKSSDISSTFLLAVGFIAVIIGGSIIYVTTRSISSPIRDITDISERVSNMDFNVKYSGKQKNEIGKLGTSINRMSDNLEAAISDLKSANLELTKDIREKELIDEKRREFIASVSHELKTPIAIIQGYAEGLKESVNSEEDRDYYCDVIMDESKKMNDLVLRLLALGQLEEAGADSLNIKRFDICALVSEYVKNKVDLLIKQRNITVNVQEHAPIFVWADEFKIEEVVTNYFSNAVKNCLDKDGKHIDVSYEMLENKVKVSIFNTGDPIAEEDIGQIWDKFYKADKSRDRSKGGTGLGLSIVKAIMDAHDQDYGVENKENGVSFYFTLDCSNDL